MHINKRIKGMSVLKIILIIAGAVLIAAATVLMVNKSPKDTLIFKDMNFSSYRLRNNNVERCFTPEQMSAFTDKLKQVKAKRIDASKIELLDGGVGYAVEMFQSDNCEGNCFGIRLINAESKGGKKLYCIDLLVTNSYNIFTISENDWNELVALFNERFLNYENVIRYDDELKLCEDYLTAYISSLFSNGEAFFPELYIDDSDMLTFASYKNKYDAEYYNFERFNSLDFHSEEAERAEYNGRICLKVPFEISYGADSGYGRFAYFEIEDTENGYKIFRALDFGNADTYSTDFDEFNVIHAEMPFEFNIKSAIGLLSVHKNEPAALETEDNSKASLNDFESIENGTPREQIQKYFGKSDFELFGMYGEIYNCGGKKITVYYDENSLVSNVVITDDDSNSH